MPHSRPRPRPESGALPGVLSPCVWPLVPVVVSSASVGGRRGAVGLAAGLSLSFAFAGSVVAWALVSLGLLVLTGVDKTLEAMAVELLPAWVYSF